MGTNDLFLLLSDSIAAAAAVLSPHPAAAFSFQLLYIFKPMITPSIKAASTLL